jgi:3-hydroxyisobutyrate dehydrogenase
MRVGFIGLGNVGAKLAGSLLRNGHDLIVHDLSHEAAAPLLSTGAGWAETPRALAGDCEAVITCLPSPAATDAVMAGPDGLLAGMAPGTLWLEMSTTSEADVIRHGEAVRAKGAAVLDAPVSGGCHRAATGNISVLAGGERADFERALPLLTAIGRRVVHTGPLGSASVVKVITNYLAGVHLVALGEALTVAKKAGIDLAVAYEAIKASSGTSFVHETESQVILNGSYRIDFTMDLALKDMSLFDGLATAHGVPVEMSPLCVDIITDGIERYGPRAWSTMVVKRLEDACGVALRAPGFPEELLDDEPEEPGAEIVVAGRTI